MVILWVKLLCLLYIASGTSSSSYDENYSEVEPYASSKSDAPNDRAHQPGGCPLHEKVSLDFETGYSSNQSGSYAPGDGLKFQGSELIFPASKLGTDVKLRQIYSKYVQAPSYNAFATQCSTINHGPAKITSVDIKSAFDYAKERTDEYARQEEEAKILSDSREASPFVTRLDIQSIFMEYASKHLQESKCLSKESATIALSRVKLDTFNIYPPLIYADRTCPFAEKAYGSRQIPICDPNYKYRSYDGSCNSLEYPLRGKSFTCHARLLPPDYKDGVSEMRSAFDGSALPNARVLTDRVLVDAPIESTRLTELHMVFGQFVVHDFTRTTKSVGNKINCCSPDATRLGTVHHEQCAPIRVSDDSSLSKMYNQTCMKFIRSVMCPHCGLGPREQTNVVTMPFDLSHVYGVNKTSAFIMRSFTGGTLKGEKDANGEEILQNRYFLEDIDLQMCNPLPGKEREWPCFVSPDGTRASQHPALSSLHVAFHRRHNQHARALCSINRHWSDERCYQEARNIHIAEFTHIVYGEYLEPVIGSQLMDYFALRPLKSGFTDYDANVKAESLTEFSTAAGRFGHSQKNQIFKVLLSRRDKQPSYEFQLRDQFFETSAMRLGHVAGVFKGLVSCPAMEVDSHVITDLKDFLYHLRDEQLGSDLPALNIQRGRDHGIPGYIHYLEFCYNVKVQAWRDLTRFIPCDVVQQLELHYKHLQDIDLFVGGVSEIHLPGAAMGPTFACLTGLQFHNFKFGDRFFYEHRGPAGSLNEAQLNNIRSVASLANHLCKTTRTESLQSSPLLVESADNKRVPCSSFREINYLLWKE